MKDRIESIINNVNLAHDVEVINNSTRWRFVEFLRKMQRQIDKGYRISPGQRNYIDSIAEQCSDKVMKEHKEWLENYSDELREVAVICADYYASAPVGQRYYQETREKVLQDPENHILSKSRFYRMCGNKYAVKVIKETLAEPKFSKGQMVEIRKSNRLDMSPSNVQGSGVYQLHRRAARGRIFAVVLEVAPRPVYRTAVGAKVYKILPLGDSNPVLVCERDIKKAR